MTIGSVSGSGVQATSSTAVQSGSDALSKSLQQQIAEKKMQLQQVSSDQELSPEEKMQKRQELQQQIFELQNQLRQHEMEMRKEAQESQNDEMEEMLGGKREPVEEDGEIGYTVSQEGMEAMISADSSLSQAKVRGSVATKLNGEAKNLKAEAELDASRGGSSEDKMNAAAALEQKASQAEVSQVKGLNKAVKKLSDAAESDREKAEGTASEEIRDIHAQYGDNVAVDISSEALTALAESLKKEQAEENAVL